MAAREFNFDGIVGPTHNYAGLSLGNVASARHRQLTSNPRAAALQGLAKMKRLAELGIAQAVLPPQPRPSFRLLHALGFRGAPAAVIEAAYRAQPALLAASYSASSMWTANAATVSPSPDCQDGHLHITPANLSSMLHRAIEAMQTNRVLKHIFRRVPNCSVHDPLPAWYPLADEGAANHTRLCREFDQPGVELFVYGRSVFDQSLELPQHFPARQTRESCQAIARIHGIPPSAAMFVQQHPHAIDAGVFHNDVISVGNQNLFLVHDMAFVNQATVLQELRQRFAQVCRHELMIETIASDELPLGDAVASYLFNSQLVTRPDGGMSLICPTECEENERAKKVVQRLLSGDNPIDSVEFLNLRQSMNNGGGPACLRLRVVLSEEQSAALDPGVIFTTELENQLRRWVETNYREYLAPEDLRDPQLMVESRDAMESLARILRWPGELLAD